MNIPYTLIGLLFVSSQGTVYTGTLQGQPTSEARMVILELKPSTRSDVPDLQPGERVLAGRVPLFKSGQAVEGLEVLVVERGETARLFADRDLDGKITDADRVADLRDTTRVTSWEHTWDLPGGPTGTTLAFRNRLSVDRTKGTRWYFYFAPTYRIEGSVDIAGRRTLVSLPFRLATGKIDVTRGYIGIDGDGDGKIDTSPLSPEYQSADGTPVVMRVGDRFVAIESADLEARSFVVRERPAAEYSRIDVRTGSPLADFSFTDFDGRSRQLSDFRGKHVLLDFWGSWCKPCVADVPMMREAYDRFRDHGFEILGIDYEMKNTSEKVRPFLKEKDVRWPNATPESARGLVEDRFKVSAFPTLILLDPNGVVVETRSGQLRGKNLMATLEKIFEKK